jgi:hypothetical protein
MIALCCQCDTVSVVIPGDNESACPAEGLPAPKVPADAARDRLIHYDLDPKASQAL